MKQKFQEKHIFYFLLCIFFVMIFMGKYGSIHIEPEDMGWVKKILHSEYPSSNVTYDPQFHYNYIVASVARVFGFEADARILAAIFWFLEQAITVIVLFKICNFLFKGDRLTLVVVVFTYLMLKSGETDQKTMLRPLHFLAIYYFLKEKWVFSAIFSASIFYLHIGVAIWWFVPSCFALCLVYLFKNKQVTFFQMTGFVGVVLLLSFPVLYHYLDSTSPTVSVVKINFLLRYWYGINNSIIINLMHNPHTLMISLITVGVFSIGYKKWKLSGRNNDYIVPIVLGVLILYVLDFVLVDLMFNGTAIKMQLLRSILNVELFSSLFFAFLIARQLRNRNYVFFGMLSILLVPNPFWYGRDALYVFYAVVVAYEIFEYPISVARQKLSALIDKKILPQSTMSVIRIHNIFQSPINLAGLLVVLYTLFVITSLSPIKPYVKSVLGIQQKTGMSKSESLFQDITRFTNEKIQDNNVVLMFPFGKVDFEFYTNHKVFIHASTLVSYIPEYMNKFQHIFEKDLNYSIEKLRSGGSWDEIWIGIDEKLIRKWRKEYGITHVIRENELPLNFPVVYQNEYYKVYDLSLLSNSQDN